MAHASSSPGDRNPADGGPGDAGPCEAGEPSPEAGSERLCAVTREPRAPHELIRFVAAPDGFVVPDLARKLPGRGVWVSCDKATVAAAQKANVFARGLKRQVSASPELAGLVESLLERRALEALSIANKAGLVTTGFAKVESLIAAGGARVLLHGSDAAAHGMDKLDARFAAVARDTGAKATRLTLFSIDQMSLAIGGANVVHAALKSGGATDRFLREAERLMRYRSLPETAI